MADVALPAARRRAARIHVSGETLLLGALAVYLVAIAVLPLGRLLAEALRPGADGAVLGVLRESWVSRSVVRALANTLVAASLSTAVSAALGTIAALLLRLTDLPGRAALAFLALVPLLIPPQISALAWIELTGPSSPILEPLGLAPPPGRTNPIYSMAGIVWVMGIEHMPLVLLTVAAGLATVPRDLAEAGRVAGARPVLVTVRIVLPAVLPSILAGAALAFVSAVGNFGVPALLGIPGRVTMLTTLIYQRLNGFGPSVLGEVAAIALLLVGLAAAGLGLRAALMRRGAAALDRAAAPMSAFGLGRWRSAAGLAAWSALLLLSVLPLVALVSTALLPAVGMRLGPDTVTLANFARLANPVVERAFLNSLLLAGSAALASALVALPLSYLAVVRRSRLARLLDLAVEAPYAVPGTVLALGVIIVFLPPLPLLGISIYGSFAILLVAYLARFLLLAHRPVAAAVEALDPALDEAARIAGAGPVRRLGAIVAPAVLPSALAGALLVFMTAFNELTVSALLWSTGNETLGVLVFQLQYEGGSTAAAALASLIVTATLALAGAIAVLGRHLPADAVPWRM